MKYSLSRLFNINFDVTLENLDTLTNNFKWSQNV